MLVLGARVVFECDEKCLSAVGLLQMSIHIAAMADLNDNDNEYFIANFIDDAIVADTNAI